MLFVRGAREGVSVGASYQRSHSYFAATVLGVAVSLIGSFAARAGDLDKVVAFDIEPQTLDKALLEFGTQAHIQIMFASRSADGRTQTVELRGKYTIKQALIRLLRGSNLAFVERGNTVELLRDPSPKSKSPGRSAQSTDPITTKAPPLIDPKSPGPGLSKTHAAKRTDRDALMEVTVTGTRIPGVQPIGVPIQTISAAQISQSGYMTTDQLMQSLPDVFRGGAEGATPDAKFQRGSNAGFNFTGGSGVDLRGLGSGATLVLFNGHRVASSSSGYFTDISSIPISAIDHIDVLTDGASAIYGSDAIAGVVNIIPKERSNGLETSARYGSGNGMSLFDANTDYGATWAGGAFSLDADYSGQDALDVRDRSFTSSIRSPTSILPMYHNAWVSAAGHEQVGPSTDVFGDVEYSESRRQSVFSAYLPVAQDISTVPRWSGSVGARYRAGASWTVTASYVAGKGTERSVSNSLSYGTARLLSGVREVERFSEPTIQATGDLFALPGGGVGVAAGGSYLVQSFSHVDYGAGYAFNDGAGRDVTSGYAELRIPVVSHANALPGVSKLTLGVAGRYDRYSDFGGTTNYKYSLSWNPEGELQVRGAYSTSFRAPAVGQELVESERGTTGALLFPIFDAQGAAKIPVLFLEGAVPHLRPETATNLTLGLDYVSVLVPNLRLSGNYYHIRYIDQLAAAPFEFTGLSDPALASAISSYPNSGPVEALVASAVANGALFVDATGGAFGADPLASTVYVYDIRTANLSRTDTSGFDFLASYALMAGPNRITAQVDATYIREFSTQLTPQAPFLDEVKTVGFPSDLRMTARAAWTTGGITAALTGNYVGGYRDTTSKPPGHVASYSTLDLFAGYLWSRSLSARGETRIAVSITNILNRNPPFVANAAMGFLGAHYDAANASPIGRVISIQVSRRW